jgi:hypothetical protein
MKTEFNVLSKYLGGVECSNNYLREVYEAKFGRHDLNFISGMWVVVYFKDNLSIVGFSKDLNVKLLFLVALLEVSPAHINLFPEKQSILLTILMAPFLVLAFLVSLFFK